MEAQRATEQAMELFGVGAATFVVEKGSILNLVRMKSVIRNAQDMKYIANIVVEQELLHDFLFYC